MKNKNEMIYEYEELDIDEKETYLLSVELENRAFRIELTIEDDCYYISEMISVLVDEDTYEEEYTDIDNYFSKVDKNWLLEEIKELFPRKEL